MLTFQSIHLLKKSHEVSVGRLSHRLAFPITRKATSGHRGVVGNSLLCGPARWLTEEQSHTARPRSGAGSRVPEQPGGKPSSLLVF